MFTHIIKPKPADIDSMGHINNVVYLRYVQEVAEAHWMDKGTQKQKNEILWVVLRHEIDYKKPAFLEDQLIGKTWVEGSEGPKTVRHVELYREKDQGLLVKARTTWCAIDAKTGRPMRLNDEVMHVFK